eukprot:2726276-Prymnesium_polylepis.1
MGRGVGVEGPAFAPLMGVGVPGGGAWGRGAGAGGSGGGGGRRESGGGRFRREGSWCGAGIGGVCGHAVRRR